MKLVTIAEMKCLEHAADEAGHTYAAMMESAGRSVARVIEQRLAIKGKRALILIGPGNNGGDGLVAAWYLSKAGAKVDCYLWKPRAKDDPNVARLSEHGIRCLHAAEDGGYDVLRTAARNASVIADALLGTGASRPIRGQLKEILDVVREAVEERRAPRPGSTVSLTHPGFVPHADSRAAHLVRDPLTVAVDVPSGLDCDTGSVDPATLPADLTVTFACPKHGQFRFPGASLVGECVVADIGIDPALGKDIQIEAATAQDVGRLLPARPLDAHKGTFGKAMVVAGSVNYTGAPYLAAAAAARVGAGLVTLAPPQPLHSILASRLAEATFVLLPHNMGVLVPAAIRVLAGALEGYAAMLLGPGLGHERETIEFVHRLLGIAQRSERGHLGFQHGTEPTHKAPQLPPLVIDADGLNALATVDRWWARLPKHAILTPHPGEMARLAGTDAGAVNEDRIGIARSKAAEWGQVVVLKGAFSVIAAPDGRTILIPFANPALSTAGTGDVLAGAIVGLRAQGLQPFDAAVCGAYLHALAAETVSASLGDSGLLASDLLPVLPRVTRALGGLSS